VLILGPGIQSADAEFPSRAIRIIVPCAAGGPSESAPRLIAEPLARHLDQSVFVENKPGAAGLGTEAFLSAAPDGYTLLTGAIGPFQQHFVQTTLPSWEMQGSLRDGWTNTGTRCANFLMLRHALHICQTSRGHQAALAKSSCTLCS
jgi:hypothetical protein